MRATEPAGTPSGTAAARPAAAPCTPAKKPDLPAGPYEPAKITSGGIERQYLLSAPASYDGTKQTPLILNFHGSGSNMQQQVMYSELATKGPDRGYIVVTPDGTGKPQGFNMFRTPGEPDDYKFVDDLVTQLTDTFCIDPDRIYSTGISNGSALSGFLTCVPPYRFAAVAMVAATVPGGNCPKDVQPSILAFHGTADPVVPYGGGDVNASAARGNQIPGAEKTAAVWAVQDGCNPTPREDRPWEHVKRLTFVDCAKGRDVVFYSIEGGGHTWPGSVIDLSKLGVTALGASSNEAHASDLMLDFFDGHTKSSPPE